MSGIPVASQSVTLTCSHSTTVANPTSTSYQWFYPNGSMAGSEAALILNSLLESQSGEYSCQVTVTDANERVGCGVRGINVQGRTILSSIHPLTTVKYYLALYNLLAPSLSVTVEGTSGMAGTLYSLTCSVMINGVSIGPPEVTSVMYTWLLRDEVVQQSSTSNQYTTGLIQVSNAGDVYTCQVAVAATYWDVSGSFEGSGSGTLTVTSKSNVNTIFFFTLISYLPYTSHYSS